MYQLKDKIVQQNYRKRHRLRVLVRKSKTRTKWDNNIDEEYIKELYDKQQRYSKE